MRRRFGREALERVAQPLVGGIYASDPDRLSLAATMPRFKEMERQRRGVILAMWSDTTTPRPQPLKPAAARAGACSSRSRGGMQELVDTLAKRLPESTLRFKFAGHALELRRRQRVGGSRSAGSETDGQPMP